MNLITDKYCSCYNYAVNCYSGCCIHCNKPKEVEFIYFNDEWKK